MTERPEKVNFRFTTEDDGLPRDGTVWAHKRYTYNDGGHVVEVEVSAQGEDWEDARKRVKEKLADIRDAITGGPSGRGCPNCRRSDFESDTAELWLSDGDGPAEVVICRWCGTVYRKKEGGG